MARTAPSRPPGPQCVAGCGLDVWMREQRAKLSRRKAEAMDYMLKRWIVFTRLLDDSRIYP